MGCKPHGTSLSQYYLSICQAIGLPEARIILSQCATYLACSPKSNAAYLAINKSLQTVKETGNLPVPLHLRNNPTQLMKELDYGKGYLYAHNYPNNFVKQTYLPKEIEGTVFYQPGGNPKEEQLKRFLNERWGDQYSY